MRLTAAASPSRDIKAWRIGSSTSPMITSGVSISKSSVRVTEPSVEFSTGTTPKSARAVSSAANTAGIEVSEAHGTLAFFDWQWDWNWRTAEEEYRYALNLNPNSVDVRVGLAWYLGWRG